MSHDLDNAAYLAACSARIGDAILTFCRRRLGHTFYGDELRNHVVCNCGLGAPASADRVLRDLRQRGRVAYTVLNRAQSLYRVDAVPTAGSAS